MKEINIAKMLVSKRKEKGITQDELASYIGVSKASVSKWETGQSYPDITFLPQLAAYFNISIDDLMGYSPQLTKEDIKRLYHRLAKEFSNKPFDEVYSKCETYIKKYYSCFGLLLQISILFLNHHMLADSEKKKNAVLEKIIVLCARIKAESEDVRHTKQANAIQAVAYLALNKPSEVIDLFDESMFSYIDERNILSSAYASMGNISKANEILQIGIYNNLITILADIPLLLSANINQTEKIDEIVKRAFSICDIFKIEQLHPNSVLVLCLTASQIFMSSGETEKVLYYLQKYADICCSLSYPLTLHGDDFFDSIHSWLADFDLGTSAPRDDKAIKESMLESVKNNPAFASLADYTVYKNIIKKLETLGGK